MPDAPWASSSTAGAATPASTDLATGASVSQINSVDYLTNLDKIQLLRDWNAELQVQAQLDAQASSFSVSSVPYDDAVAALSTNLIAAGAPSNWATTWPDGITSGPWTAVLTNLRTWWTAIATQRATLQNIITSTAANNAQSAAISAAATDASNKALDAINKSQLHPVAWASSALPTLPSGTYPAGYLAQTTDNRKFQVNAGGTAWGEITQAAIGIFGQIVASQMVLTDLTNLAYNASFDADISCWVNSNNMAWTGSQGYNYVPGYCYTTVPGMSASMTSTNNIRCAQGQSFYAEAWIYGGVTSGYGQVLINWMNASGAVISQSFGNQITAAGWQKSSIIGYAPSGTVYAAVVIQAITPSSAMAFDAVSFRRQNNSELIVDGAVTAQKLESVLAITGTIQSPNYVAGAYGSAPVGFKQSGYAFTTTFLDGTTDANCFMEIQGTANFGGYKVATVNNRTMTAYNRILNGAFFWDLTGWTVNNGTVPMVWSSTTRTAGTGSAALNPVATGLTAGRISQAFNCPPTSASVTLSLWVKVIAGLSQARVMAIVYNTATGVTTTVADWTACTGYTAFTNLTVDVTSLVSVGGDFVLQLFVSTTGVVGESIVIDEVKLIV